MAATNYSPEIAAQIEDYFKSKGWSFDPVDENGIIRAGMGLRSKLRSCRLFIFVKNDGFCVNSALLLRVEEAEREAVMEYITRANFGLTYGNFEMGVDDGDVRFKTCLFCGDTVPSLNQIEHTITTNILLLERYGDGLAKLIFGFGNVKEAIEEAEGTK